MNNNHSNIRKKLLQKQDTPSPNAWERIEAQLDNKSKSSSKKYIIWRIAAVCAGAMIGIYFLYMPQKQSQSIGTNQFATTSATNQPHHASTNKIEATNIALPPTLIPTTASKKPLTTTTSIKGLPNKENTSYTTLPAPNFIAIASYTEVAPVTNIAQTMLTIPHLVQISPIHLVSNEETALLAQELLESIEAELGNATYTPPIYQFLEEQYEKVKLAINNKIYYKTDKM